MRFARMLVVLALAATPAAPAHAQSPERPSAATLRTLYFQHDYAGAFAAGRPLLKGADPSPEAVAWLVASMAADERADDARETAARLVKKHPGGRWTEFAQAIARVPRYGSAAEAEAPAARARAQAPWDPDMVWLQADVLGHGGTEARGIALLDSAAARQLVTPELLVLRGEIETRRWQHSMGRDSAAPVRAMAAFDAALKLDSLTAGAWLGKVMLFEVQGSPGGALEAARRAREAAPLALETHGAWWMALRERRAATAEANTREVLEDMESLARARPGWASTLVAEAGLFHELKLEDRARAAEAELRSRYPGSYELESFEIRRIQRLASELMRQQAADSVAARAELRRRLDAFVGTPGHRRSNLASAYEMLFESIKGDSTVPAAELSRLAEGLTRNGEPSGRGTVVPLVLLMAERHADPVLAERLARQIPARLKADEAHIVYNTSDTSTAARKRFEKSRRDEALATMHDALGWIYFNAGRLADAAREQAAARRLSRPGPTELYHAGQLAERQGRPDEAQKLYLKGYPMERGWNRHPNEAALRMLYARRNGSLQGFDTLVAALRARDREASKAGVLARRIKAPRPLPPFKLARLEGGTFSTDELKGKIGVVNFWGLWCPPCVAELPQLEKLRARYRNDPDVVIVTIDNDPDPQAVRDFVARRKLDLPVLLDDSLSRHEVKGWPTTWFVDRKGRIAYQMDGATVGNVNDDEIVEELAWRVESLRDTAAPATKAAPPASREPTDAVSAAQRLRTLYFLRDFWGAAAEGQALLRRFPGAPEVAAWYLASLALSGHADQAIAAADSLLRAHAAGPWAHFARALALAPKDVRAKEALAEAVRARAAAPSSPDAWWLYAAALFRAGQVPASIAVCDSAMARFGASAALLTQKGLSQERQILKGATIDTVAVALAAATYEQAIAADSLAIVALCARGNLYDRRGDLAAGYRMYRLAAERSPYATGVHEGYWSRIQGLRDRTEEQKREEIVGDADRLLRARSDDPSTLRVVAGAYDDLKLTARRDSLENDLLARFSESSPADGVRIDRVYRLSSALNKKEVPDTIAARRELLRMLWEYVSRPVHPYPERLANAYTSLFLAVAADSTSSAADLERAARGAGADRMNPYIANIRVPTTLADRKVALPLAEQLAREAPARLHAWLEETRNSYTSERYAEAEKAQLASAHDALGWVYFAEGKRALALRELETALKLNPRFSDALHHMGRVQEAGGRTAQAESYYVRGYAAERRLRNHPSEDALKRLYAARHGSAQGYEAFIADLQEKARAERRSKVLEERVKNPQPAPGFKLAKLEGGTFSSEALQGKIGVVNFWGIWCGPCVAELPQIQKLWEKYRGDSDVVFLTVDNDADVSKVREFMARRKFDFPVLVDDGFVARVGLTGWPTTWIIDRSGRIAFKAVGGSDSDTLLEDYVWRIESLRAPAGTPKAAPQP